MSSLQVIGRNIRRLRRRRQLTQDVVARMLHKDRSTITRYERAEAEMPVSVFVHLLKILRASPNEVLGFRDGHGRNRR